MNKRNAVIITIVILIATLLDVAVWTSGNGTVSLSGGAISDVPLYDGTVYETTFETPEKGAAGIGLHISYPVGTEMSREQLHISLKDAASGETVLDGVYSLKNTGYAGQRVNEGVLPVPFAETLEGGRRIRLSIGSEGIKKDRGVMLRLRDDPRGDGVLLRDGEAVSGGLYASVYTPGKPDVPVSSIVVGLTLAAAVLCWGFLAGSGKAASREKEPRKAKKQRPQGEDSRAGKPRPKTVRIPARRWALLILILIIQLAVLEFGYYAGIRHSLDEKIERSQKSKQTIVLKQGESVSFDLPAETRGLSGIGLDLQYGYQTDQALEISVKEKGSDAASMTASVTTDEILPDRDGASQIFRFPETIRDSADKTYTVSLKYLSGSGDLELTAAKNTQEDAPPEPYACGVYRTRQFLLKLYILISLLTVLGTCLIWYCCAGGIDWQRWFPAVLLCAGLCFMLLVKPFSVPDETVHLDEAYKISNNLLGIPQSAVPEAIYKRSCDTQTDLLSKEKLDGEAYRWVKDTLRAGIRNWPTRYDEDLQLVYARRSGTGTSRIFHIPAALGLTAGRLLGFGFMGIMYLARLCQFLTGAALLVFAVRRIPVGKPVLAALAFMPTTMMELVSVSYDAVIIPVCFACFAETLRLLMDTETPAAGDAFPLFILAVLTGISKAGVYAPLGIMSVIVLFLRMRQGKAETDPDPGRGKKLRKILPWILLAVAAAAVLASFGRVYAGNLDPAKIVRYNSRTESAGYTLAYLMRHPMQAFRVLEGTLYWGPGIPLGISGNGIGWNSGISLDIVIRFIGIIYVAFSCVRIQGEAVPGKRMRRAAVLVFCLSAAAFNYAMLTEWTGLGEASVSGVQARYYLPVLPVLLVALRGRSPVFTAGGERAGGVPGTAEERDEGSPERGIRDYRNTIERNFVIAGYGFSILAVVSFVIKALG